jgi:hypothetical protein
MNRLTGKWFLKTTENGRLTRILEHTIYSSIHGPQHIEKFLTVVMGIKDIELAPERENLAIFVAIVVHLVYNRSAFKKIQ